MHLRRSVLFGPVCLVVLVVGGCGGDAPFVPGPGPWDDAFEIPFEEPPPGDPVAGFEALVTKGYVSCGIPADVFPLARGFLGWITSGQALVDEEGVPLRSGKNADMPYNWNVHANSEGVDIASLNCLQCHAEKFNGKLVVGLGSVTGDYTAQFGGGLGSTLLEALDIDTLPGGQELEELVLRQEAIGFQSTQATVGTNPAVTIAVALASHRDAATLAWLDEPHTPLPQIRLPVDVPPWWRTKKKSTHFYNGMSRGDHRGTMMLASMLCTDTNEEAAEIMSYFGDVYAFIRSIEAPAYPFEVSKSLADRGKQVFLENCAGCHGTYGKNDAADTYPNLIVPIDVIETDPTYAAYEDNIDDLQSWFAQTYYAEFSEISIDQPTRGYTAPPLDGVWATAPFLHNGSVPTLEALLNSIERPVYWSRVDYNSANFDQERVGWPYEELAYGQDEASDEERKFIYDTTLVGHGNSGHTFGDKLDYNERRAVIEYLKTL